MLKIPSQELIALASERGKIGLGAHDALACRAQVLPPELTDCLFLNRGTFDGWLIDRHAERVRRSVTNGVVLANLVESAFQVLDEARGGKLFATTRATLLRGVLTCTPVKFDAHR